MVSRNGSTTKRLFGTTLNWSFRFLFFWYSNQKVHPFKVPYRGTWFSRHTIHTGIVSTCGWSKPMACYLRF
jgi:hypothetical protein